MLRRLVLICFDLSHVFDHDEFIYIDFCHVSANGNEYMANALANILL